MKSVDVKRRVFLLCVIQIDVILTTYNMISSKHDDKKFFKNFSINYVVYDEGHMLKNCSTDRYRNLMKVKVCDLAEWFRVV